MQQILHTCERNILLPIWSRPFKNIFLSEVGSWEVIERIQARFLDGLNQSISSVGDQNFLDAV